MLAIVIAMLEIAEASSASCQAAWSLNINNLTAGPGTQAIVGNATSSIGAVPVLNNLLFSTTVHASKARCGAGSLTCSGPVTVANTGPSGTAVISVVSGHDFILGDTVEVSGAGPIYSGASPGALALSYVGTGMGVGGVTDCYKLAYIQDSEPAAGTHKAISAIASAACINNVPPDAGSDPTLSNANYVKSAPPVNVSHHYRLHKYRRAAWLLKMTVGQRA